MTIMVDALGSFVPATTRALIRGRRGAVDDVRDSATLFVDVVGFTQLSTDLASRTLAAAEELARTLNGYIGAIVDAVLDQGGDVLMFAGDAITVRWDREDLARAIAAAEDVVKRTAAVDVGSVPLGVRIGVGVGEVRSMVCGGVDGRWHDIHVGQGAADAAAAASRAPVNSVGISDAAAAASTSMAPPSGRSASEVVDPPARLRPFVHETALAFLDDGREAWLAELRTVTTVFALLPDFDQDREFAELDRAVRDIQVVVGRFDGSLTVTADDKGVVLLVTLGMPPRSHEDDPRRGLLLGLALGRALADLDLRAHLGVATGRAWCGFIGNRRRRAFTLLGAPVNLAARLMGKASVGYPNGSVLADPAAMQAGGAFVRSTALEPVHLRGFEAPIVPALLLGAAQAPAVTRNKVVGRVAERAALAAAAASKAGDAKAPVVVVEGEAGIGKSSLLADAVASAAAAGRFVAQAQGDALSVQEPYAPIRALMAQLLGPVDGDPEEVIRARLGPDLGPMAHVLNPVLPVQLSGEGRPGLPADAGPAIAGQMIVGALIALAMQADAVVVLEDLHWFDDASANVVAGLVQARALPVLASTRPAQSEDSAPGWLSAPDIQRLPLTGVGLEETCLMVADALGVTSVDDRVASSIHGRAGGHPFFIRELARAMADTGLVDVADGVARPAGIVDLETAALPDTVEGILTNRIDALAGGAQVVLKAAALVGRRVDIGALQAIAGLAEPELLEQVAELEMRGLFIRPLADDGQPAVDEVEFVHALVRDVAADRVPYDQRCWLHAALGKWYEAHEGADPSRLAHHWEAAWLHGQELERPPVAMSLLAERAGGHLAAASLHVLANGLPPASIDLGLRALRVVGVDLPRDEARVAEELGRELALAREHAPDDDPQRLLDLPRLDRPELEQASLLMLQLQPAANMSQLMDLYLLLGLRNYRLVREHGIGVASPGAIAVYAAVGGMVDPDRHRALARGTVAMEIVRRDGPSPVHAYAAFVVHHLISHWVRPLGADVDLAEEGHAAAEDFGDHIFACFNLASHVMSLALSGAHLDEVIAKAEEHTARIADRVHSAAFHCRLERQVAQALAGRTAGLQALSDDAVDEDRELASVLQTPSLNQVGTYLLTKARLALLDGDHERALEFGARALQVEAAFASTVDEIHFTFHHGIALLRHAAQVDGEARQAALDAAADRCERLRGWAEVNPHNFASRLAVQEGVRAQVDGDLARAQQHLREAAVKAADAGHPEVEGLALEYLAQVQAEAGDRAGAAATAKQAMDVLGAWGAHARVAGIQRRLGDVLVDA